MSDLFFSDSSKFRQTKIIGTIGPASNSPSVIKELLLAGMNVARLNFSHGTHEQHSKTLATLREEAGKLNRPLAIFQDLCGPKVRIAEFEDGEILLTAGQEIELRYFTGNKGTPSIIYVEAFDPTKVLRPTEKALLADGQIELIVISVDREKVVCRVISGGPLRSRSGIAVTSSKLNLPCLTTKDLEDLRWGLANDIDYVALSFVKTEKDVLELRERIRSAGKNIPIISKIERASALDHLTDIIRTSDAVMIARGDLGLELPLERVPAAQKLIIDEALRLGTPVITATQMLRTMVDEARPTRAEASDVYTAVRDGTDAVMLSEETAIGKYPVESVQILHRICIEAEKELSSYRSTEAAALQETNSVPESISYAACGAAAMLHAAGIVVCTLSGRSSRMVSKYRPRFPIYGATEDPRAMNRMALVWGVEPVSIQLGASSTTEDEVSAALNAVRERYGLKPGARMVITAGLRTKRPGATNTLQVREIPRST